MGHSIDKITLEGFKSIESLRDFSLSDVNVLIGANGCGKSNFVSFFYLLREIVETRLEKAVNKAGGADRQLYLGPKVTEKIHAKLEFGWNAYSFTLEPTADNRLIFGDERVEYHPDAGMRTKSVDRSIGTGHSESKLQAHVERGDNHIIAKHVYEAVSSWTVYHVHDTSETARMRRQSPVDDDERLQPDAGNLAPFLNHLQESDPSTFRLIVDTIRLVAPFFKDFRFRPKKLKDIEVVQLDWIQQGSEYHLHPSQLSDGTLRFIALATALLQPTPPATILIDEPELGLHPSALGILADLILQARERTQLIVSTQSAQLLDNFDPAQIVVVEREDGASTFRRLDDDDLKNWLEDYSLGELWQKNVYGGGPVYE